MEAVEDHTVCVAEAETEVVALGKVGECVRNAAKKFERNGRLLVMVGI